MPTILDKINEKSLPPPPLPQNQGWGKWCVLAFARLSSLIWRGRRFTAPFYFVQECKWERAQSASVMGIRGKREKRFACLFTFSPLPITPFALSFFNYRPFLSSSKLLFQSEANCEAIDFHKKRFALSLVLKGRVLGTRKWPIKSNIPPPPHKKKEKVIASNWERGSLLYILYIPERVVK